MSQRRLSPLSMRAPALAVSWALTVVLVPPFAPTSAPAQIIMRKVQVQAKPQPEAPATGPTAPAFPPVTAPAPTPTTTPVLNLASGGFALGVLKDVDRPGVLRWQASAFVSPFEFGIDTVNSLQAPTPANPKKPEGEYCFELTGGDILFGNLTGLDDDNAVLDVPRLGPLHIARGNVHRIYRWRESADLIYLGPNGLSGWRESPENKNAWKEESGQPSTDQSSTALQADLGLPDRCAIEFEVSWKSKPDFVLALGVGNDDRSIQRAFRFEVWEEALVVQREADTEADVAQIMAIPAGPGRVHVQAFLDQEHGRLLVFSTDGKRLADLAVPDRQRGALGGLRLENKRGDIKLERLRVARWNGEAPREAEADRARIHRNDGSILYGRVVRYDAGAREFIVAADGEETRVPEDRISGLFLSLPGKTKARAVRAVAQDGARLSGDLLKIAQGELFLAVPGIKETPRLAVDTLRSLVVLRDEAKTGKENEAKPTGGKPGEPNPAERTGRLDLDGVSLPGRLIDGRTGQGASCLVWKPAGSDLASALRAEVSGRIVFKESSRPVTPNSNPNEPAPQPQPPALGRVGGFLRGFAGNAQPATQVTPGARRSLYLRTGDVVPIEVTKIDENGITFKTTMSASTFVTHDKVKAVELASEPAATVRLNRAKRERLLTLPRMQRDSPPTHIIRSKNGDYLRGRILSMNDKTLQLETRLETREVPRNRVSRIIWLHADEFDPAKAPKPAAADVVAAGPTRVQAVRSDGIRLTFNAERLDGQTLSGKSEVLGACQVRLGEVDQLLINTAIEQAAAQLVYQQWKLRLAPDPKVLQNDLAGAEGRPSGTEAAMVGKPAPDFELDLLDGKKFRLNGHRGKVVILDFWATWCGPCLQAMPQVEKVAGEFQDQGVELVAINLQEAPKTITDMLERHKLHMTVALDRNGIVAEKYGANAIPQTVIVDRDGTVARLFVGGGPHFDDQLREALKKTLNPGEIGDGAVGGDKKDREKTLE